MGDVNFTPMYLYNDYKHILDYMCVKHLTTLPMLNIITLVMYKVTQNDLFTVF